MRDFAVELAGLNGQKFLRAIRTGADKLNLIDFLAVNGAVAFHYFNQRGKNSFVLTC